MSRINSVLKNILAHPLNRGIDINAPQAAMVRRKIIREKTFLNRIYGEWYALLLSSLPPGKGEILELGSAGGFLEDLLPGVITSDVFYSPDIDLVTHAGCLPFAAHSLRGIVMTNVLHHIAEPTRFFDEASRCIRPGGVIAMIEPWVNGWSSFVHRWLHHEPFLPEAAEWNLPTGGGFLSTANGALPWIIFHRDREKFERAFPEWEIRDIMPFMPLRYVLSGGVSMRSLMPSSSFAIWKMLDKLLCRYGMFARIILVRRNS